MILQADFIRSGKSKQIIFMICIAFLVSSAFAQTGVVNNGAKMIINTGAVLKITGTGADYTNATEGVKDGRIDLDGKIEIEGDWINNAATGNVMINFNTIGEVLFNGSSQQNILGSTAITFENLTIDNSSGLSLSNDVTVRKISTLTNGNVLLNNNHYTVGTTGSLSGTFGTTRMFVVNGTGTLKKAIGGTGAFSFPIGEINGTIEYCPVDFNLIAHSGLTNAFLSARVVNSKHVNNTSPSEFLSRYWTLAKSGTFNVTNSSLVFHYQDADVTGTEADIYAAQYNGVTRNVYSKVTAGSNIFTINGLTTYADFTGVDGTVPIPTISTTELNPTNADPIPFTVTFSEEVTGFAYTDISIDNGSTSAVSTLDNITFDFNVTPTLDGNVTVNINSGVAKDIAGNDNTASNTYVIKFDSTNPTIAITSSEPDPTNTAVDFKVTFSEVVTGFASGDITIGNGSVTSFVEQTTGLVWDVTVTPTTDGLVTVNISSGLAIDAAGNGNDAASPYSITFDDNAPIVLISSSESVLTNANPIPITITFNETVTGFALADILSNGTVGNLVNTTPGLVWTAQVTPSGNGTVTVDINSDIAQDAATNGNTAATQFSIDYDGTKPSVTISSLEVNPTNSSPFEITITFNEIVNDFVVGDITVGNGTAGNLQTVTANTIWTADITPSADALVTVNISADVATDDAGNGNTASSQYSISYDGTDPSVLGFNPSDDETSVSIASNLEITFNEAVNAVSGNIILIETGVGTVETFDVTTDITGDGTSTISINPASDLSSSTAYHIQIDATAFADDAGNSFAGIADQTTWNFTSSDVNNPYIIAKSPSDNAVEVSLATDLEITFSENVKANSGYIRLYNSSDVQIKAFDVTSEISILNDVISIDLSSVTLIGETAYYILIDNNAIQDLTSNPFAGISSKLTWNFTTEDVTGPTISVLSPLDGAGNVLISSDLTITFNENVAKGTGNIIITNATLASQHESIDVNSGQVTISSNVVTINPGTDFDGESDYYVEMAAGVFTDASSNTNDFDGIAGSTAWNYTTEDVTSPTVVVSTSEVSPTNSSPFIVTITFNEVMTGFVSGDISVTNCTADNLSTSDSKVFTIEITPSVEGNVFIIVPAGVATDASGNANEISNELTVEFDSTSPTVVISSLESGIIASDFDVTITFNEEITDLILGNIMVGNGTASNLINQVSGTEWDVTITPTTDGTVTVEVSNDVVTDIAGNGNITSNQFSIEYDGSGPVISSLDPSNGETSVAVNSNLQITFDEPVDLNIGNIEIYYQSNDALVESISVASATGDGTNTITINPSDFNGETTYYVLIDAEAFMDGLGNGFAGISSTSDWVFTTEDVTAPTVDALSPDGVSNVLVNANLEITFSEDVTKNIGVITIMNEDTGEEHESIDVAGGQVTVSGNVVTIDPSITFVGETNYYVLVGESTFQDLSGNNFAGISSTTDWTFYTEDIEPPVISTVSPSDNALNVPISTNLIITFSENIVEGSGNIVIMNEAGPAVHETIPIGAGNVTISGNELTINPTTDFDGLSNYYVLIGGTAVDDAFGNSFAGITNPADWNFTTVDASAPAVSGFTPGDNETGVTSNPNLMITFNEDVNAISGKFITIMNSTTGLTHETIDAGSASVDVTANMVTVDPSINFDDLSNYYVLIEYGAFQDIDANSYPGIADAVSWNFTTGDNTAPVVSGLTPADDDIDVALTQNLIIEFSENITANSGNITIVNSTTSATIETIDVTSGQVVISTNTVTINPAIDFTGNTNYHVLIDNDAFRDAAGNAYTGISEATAWNYTTIDQGDITDPTIVSVSPTDGSTGVLITANLQLTFSEIVVANTGSIIIMQGTTVHESIDVTSGQVSFASNVVTINPAINFNSETDYNVLIDNEAFRDLAGNPFAGISTATDWNFTTVLVTDAIAPTIVSVSPMDDATEVVVNSNLQISFSENVVANTGLITIMKGTTTQESIDVLSTKVTIVADLVTINPEFDFDGETNYYVVIDNSAFHDESGNAFTGISDQTVWNFTTEDVTQPTVAITSTASGTVNGSFDVTITFSEVVTGFTEGDVTLVNGSISEFTETTTGQVWTLTIEPVADGDVTVDVNAGVAQDAAGNNNIAATQFSIVYDSGVGFEDIIPYEISIYSIKNRVIIDFTNEGNYQFKEGLIEVYNLLGQKIVEKNIEKFERFETEVEHVTQIYVVKVIIDGTEYTKRLYIE
jgi:methionine-rich copper-binding protein CopC